MQTGQTCIPHHDSALTVWEFCMDLITDVLEKQGFQSEGIANRKPCVKKHEGFIGDLQ